MPVNKEIKWVANENGCHICTSHYSDRYVQKWYNNRLQKLHRVVYSNEYLGGEDIPDGMVIRHKCDNPNCINPKHLEIGTQKDNMDDMFGRGRGAIGQKHGMAKLTDEKVVEIFYSKGTNRHIGSLFGISASMVSIIKNKKRWIHVVGNL